MCLFQNTAHPINGIYQMRPGPSQNISPTIAGILFIYFLFPFWQEMTFIMTVPEASDVTGTVVQQGIELGSECVENSRRHSRTMGECVNSLTPQFSVNW